MEKTETQQATMASFQDEAKKRSISVTINAENGKVVVSMSYSGR